MLERELLEKIREGDLSAFRCFMNLYSKDLYLFALGYVRIRELAEEIVSDVFLSVWQNRNQLEKIHAVKTWLLVITRNQAISYLRKENIASVVSIQDIPNIDDYFIPYIQLPDHQLISQEEVRRINDAINTLPPKCKEVFMLAKIEKLPYKEISQILNISVKTINIHISKAITSIEKILNN